MRCFLASVAVLAAGCRIAPDAPISTQVSHSLSASSALSTNPSAERFNIVGDSTELALTAQVKALLPPAGAAYVEHQLSLPSTVGITVPRSDAQAIVDRIFARRRSHADSIAANHRGIASNIQIQSVAIALVDSLTDRTASAEIRRRTNMEPHDIILLPAGHATPGALQAAVHGLSKIMRDEGQSVPTRNLRVAVHGEMHLKSWTAAHNAEVAALIADVAGHPSTLVRGVGNARTFSLLMGRQSP
jgi:hypothetical protein